MPGSGSEQTLDKIACSLRLANLVKGADRPVPGGKGGRTRRKRDRPSEKVDRSIRGCRWLDDRNKQC